MEISAVGDRSEVKVRIGRETVFTVTKLTNAVRIYSMAEFELKDALVFYRALRMARRIAKKMKHGC